MELFTWNNIKPSAAWGGSDFGGTRLPVFNSSKFTFAFCSASIYIKKGKKDFKKSFEK